MLLLATHYLRGAVIVNIACTEQWFGIIGTVRCKLLQIVVQTLGNILKVDNRIDIECSLSLFRLNVLHYIFLEAAAELRDVLDLERKAYSIGVTAKVLEQIATALDGIVHIVASHTAGRTCSNAVELSEYYRGAVVKLSESRSHNADNTLFPVLVVKYDTGVVLLTLQLFYDLVGLFGHLLVNILTLFVVLIDMVSLGQRLVQVFLNQQVDSLGTILHTS